MKIGYSAAVAGVAAALLVSPASAATVNFTATTTVADLLANPILNYTSLGLSNTAISEAGLTIPNYITANFDNNSFISPGSWNITATFTFSVPTPTGTTNATGTISGVSTAPPNSVNSVTIDWAPAFFDFAGTTLLVDLHDTTFVCSPANCNQGPAGQSFSMDGFFQIVEAPHETPTTPLPAAVWLLGTVLAGGAGFGRWRKRKARAAV